MTCGERVKEIRKTLNLTLEKFGDKIGVTKTTISRIENGVNNLTDQMIKSICREFNVNEEWLRSGTGEMFEELLPEDEFTKAAAEIAKGDRFAQEIILAYWRQNEEGKAAIRDFLSSLASQAGIDIEKE